MLQGAGESQEQYQEDVALRGHKLRNLSMRLDAAADQMSSEDQIMSHPGMQVQS